MNACAACAEPSCPGGASSVMAVEYTPESPASRTPYTQPTTNSSSQPTPPSQPNPNERQPLAAAIVSAARARPQRSESQPPPQTPKMPTPAMSAAHWPASDDAATASRP